MAALAPTSTTPKLSLQLAKSSFYCFRTRPHTPSFPKLIRKPIRLPKPEAFPPKLDDLVDNIGDLPCLLSKGCNSLQSLATSPTLTIAILIVLFFRYLWYCMFPRKITLPISEFDESDYNYTFAAIETYLSTKKWGKRQTKFEDIFEGTRFSWKLTRQLKSKKKEDFLLDMLKILGSDNMIIKVFKILMGYYRRYSCTGARTAYVSFYLSEYDKTARSYFNHIREFQPPKDGGSRLHVTNLFRKIRKSRLHVLFSEFGPVNDITISYDKVAGMGIVGVVDFVFKADAVKAIAKLNGYYYHHLNLKVEWAA